MTSRRVVAFGLAFGLSLHCVVPASAAGLRIPDGTRIAVRVMEQLGGFTLLLLFVGAVRHPGDTFQQRFERIRSSGTGLRQRPRARVRRGPRSVVLLFDDVGKDESIPAARHGANEARLARVVAERAANRADRLTQRAVGDDDIVPDSIEDIAAVQRLVTTLDQEDEEVEVARDERQLEPVTDEKPSARRHNEIAEVVAGTAWSRGRAIVSERLSPHGSPDRNPPSESVAGFRHR